MIARSFRPCFCPFAPSLLVGTSQVVAQQPGDDVQARARHPRDGGFYAFALRRWRWGSTHPRYGELCLPDASLGCPDCVDVEPCVWPQLSPPRGNESSRQARALQLRARSQNGPALPAGGFLPRRTDPCSGASGRVCDGSQGSLRPAVRFCSGRTRSGKRKNTLITLQPEPLAVRQLDVDAT